MRTWLWALILSLVVALPAGAQETRGNISGTVKDSTGVIPGATVKITSTDTGASQDLITNSSGYFEAPLMQPGDYAITVEMTGFKKLSRTGIVLAVGQRLEIPLTLELGAISETITVTGEAPLLDTNSVASAQTFDTRMVEGLPMISNMPIMLTRFAQGVNPATNQSLVSQGFVDGTTTAAGSAVGGVGSNTYSIDGASNGSTGRRIATSPNSDMIEEMRVESSNFDASIGHGTGLQISMMTKAGANQYRGTGNYTYWTNKFSLLNPNQKATFSPSGKAAYDKGRDHNTAWTLGGPVFIPGLVNGHNKLFFFFNYSYVNDYIPGKNQGTSTIPASAAELNGDFSDLLKLPNPAQYQIYDPLTVHRDPANANRFIRDPFPGNIIPANRIVNPLYNLYKQMLPKPNQNFVENGTTPSNNYYRGAEPDIPKSQLVAGRIDYNVSSADRIFIRGSKNTFIEGVGDWTSDVPDFAGLHSSDRSRPQWNMVGNWTHTSGTMVFDTQLAGNHFFQGDLFQRLHEFKPTDMGLPNYLNDLCTSQNNCMLPVVNIGGYQGISAGASSFDRGRNYQGTFNVTKVTSAHTLRGGVDARLAQRLRSAGGNPSGSLSFDNSFTRQASDTSQLTPSNLGLSLAAFMLGIPTTTSATIQQAFAYRNHYFAGFGQDSWRLTQNLTLNVGLRFEWEDGIKEDSNAMVTSFDPTAKLTISDLAEAAYAKSPVAGMAPADFHVRGGSIYASAPGQDGASWRPEAMWMPRVAAAYKLGEKTVVKAGYGIFYDTLNATDYGANNLNYNSTTTSTNSTDFGQTFTLGNPYAGVLGISDPFPVRADGTRFQVPLGASLGLDSSTGVGFTDQNQNHVHARQQKWRIGLQRELVKNLSVEVAYDASFSDRGEVSIRQDYLPKQFWIPGSLNARDSVTQAALVANVPNPYSLANFASLQSTNPALYQKMAGVAFFTSTTAQANRLLRNFSQINNLTYDNLPLGEVKVKQLQINVNRRFAKGFTSNVALSFSNVKSNRTVEEYDRAPTLWQNDNSGRPYRLSGGVVYELPFGDTKPMLNKGGILAALAGGWQLAGTFEVQPGSLLSFTSNTTGAPGGNVFYTGDINNIKKSNPEIALSPNGTIDQTKYWFNIDGFERDSAKTPTSFQTRAFPFQIEGLRGPGLHYVNLNVLRNFRVGGRRSIQTRLDVQNVLNYAAFSNPVLDPTNTNFGKVVTAVSSAGAMRFVNFGVRFAF
jgi:hypothetical protein